MMCDEINIAGAVIPATFYTSIHENTVKILNISKLTFHLQFDKSTSVTYADCLFFSVLLNNANRFAKK